MPAENPNPPEILDALRFRARIAVAEIDRALDRGARVSPDATGHAVSAWGFELLSAASGFLAACSDADDELGD